MVDWFSIILIVFCIDIITMHRFHNVILICLMILFFILQAWKKRTTSGLKDNLNVGLFIFHPFSIVHSFINFLSVNKFIIFSSFQSPITTHPSINFSSDHQPAIYSFFIHPSPIHPPPTDLLITNPPTTHPSIHLSCIFHLSTAIRSQNDEDHISSFSWHPSDTGHMLLASTSGVIHDHTIHHRFTMVLISVSLSIIISLSSFSLEPSF